MNPDVLPAVCELPQGMVGTPRCTKTADHVADIHGCLVEQRDKEWVRLQVCFDHIVTGHKAWTRMKEASGVLAPVCTDCGKRFARFRDMFRKVGR